MALKDHNKGQSDAARGVYERPHSNLDQLSDVLKPWVTREEIEEKEQANQDYDAGHQHTTDQNKGCFLSSACFEAAGLTDSCVELQTLRTFRDSYVAHLPGGIALIEEYYVVAPHIVDGISQLQQSHEIWQGIFADIQEAVQAIHERRYDHALFIYRELVRNLGVTYLPA